MFTFVGFLQVETRGEPILCDKSSHNDMTKKFVIKMQRSKYLWTISVGNKRRTAINQVKSYP